MFGTHYNHLLGRFNSSICVPSTEGEDLFRLNWAGENNWLVPPVNIIPRTINHVTACNGTLVAPYWPSALFLVNDFKTSDIPALKPNSDIFVQRHNYFWF